MHDAGRVGRAQRRTRLACNVQHTCHAESPLVRQALLQRDSFEKLHQDVGCALRCHARVENFDDVGMTDGAGSPGFVEKAPD